MLAVVVRAVLAEGVEKTSRAVFDGSLGNLHALISEVTVNPFVFSAARADSERSIWRASWAQSGPDV
eukprot:CAMPEP_0182582292 /NCGR_PEP_ID=MMETSP1324-20130603/52183_1 /TAXON_ID=236786 /ORGANISM="Florenciella sp., Strain RCC1587" /LENGTH=66 /DNA_ID=CAMNT_0024798739 /DNA_START=1 /DNA_END=197 /DNA_ORIENTATION=+